MYENNLYIRGNIVGSLEILSLWFKNIITFKLLTFEPIEGNVFGKFNKDKYVLALAILLKLDEGSYFIKANQQIPIMVQTENKINLRLLW